MSLKFVRAIFVETELIIQVAVTDNERGALLLKPQKTLEYGLRCCPPRYFPMEKQGVGRRLNLGLPLWCL